MKRSRINEDTLPPQLPVILSDRISQQIDKIGEYNKNNKEALEQWLGYIDSVVNYVSNPAIAWDYNNRHIRFPNGTRFIRDFDYNVGYSIKTNGYVYVYIYKMNLMLEEFGLISPQSLEENHASICITESQLRHIIRETLTRLYN